MAKTMKTVKAWAVLDKGSLISRYGRNCGKTIRVYTSKTEAVESRWFDTCKVVRVEVRELPRKVKR